LSNLEKEMKLEAEKTILCAAKLIAPVIEDTLTAGFAWYTLKNSKKLRHLSPVSRQKFVKLFLGVSML